MYALRYSTMTIKDIYSIEHIHNYRKLLRFPRKVNYIQEKARTTISYTSAASISGKNILEKRNYLMVLCILWKQIF